MTGDPKNTDHNSDFSISIYTHKSISLLSCADSGALSAPDSYVECPLQPQHPQLCLRGLAPEHRIFELKQVSYFLCVFF